MCTFSLLVVCLLSAAPSEAAERLFVFHGDEAYASVYDVGALNRVETVAVEPGAFAAFGVPAISGGSFEKFYVLSETAVVILDGSLSVRGRLTFPEPIRKGPNTAALSAEASRLVVIAGQKVYIVDTGKDSIVAELNPGFPPSGVVVRPGSGSAFLTSAESNLLGRIDLLED
ncbi:MAG: hypothetical protein GY953_25525, partial [bacterium]|nr:hypothetical protein [bacterium]